MDICILRLKDPLVGPYLCAFLQSPAGQIRFLRRRRGSSRQVEIYPEDILEVLVPRLGKALEQAIGERWLSAVGRVADSKGLRPKAEKMILDAASWEDMQAVNYANAFSYTISAVNRCGRIDVEFFNPRFSDLDMFLRAGSSMPFLDCVSGQYKGHQPASYSAYGSTTVIKSKDVTKLGINILSCDRCDQTALDDEVPRFLTSGQLLIDMTGVGTLGRAAVVPTLSGAL